MAPQPAIAETIQPKVNHFYNTVFAAEKVYFQNQLAELEKLA